MPPMVTDPQVRSVSRLFKALADDTRLRIIALLSHGELCVCHVVSALGISQPGASRHLAILRQADVVTSRRQRNWVYYKLATQHDPAREEQLRVLVKSFARQRTLRDGVRRLLGSCGPGACS